MGIGTSLGAYFETPLDHHAGNDTGVIKPGDTGDDMVIPPDENPQANGSDTLEIADHPRSSWKNLSPEEQKDLADNSKKVFPDAYESEEDIKGLIYKHGAIETYPDNSTVQKFLDNIPSDMEVFDYQDDPNRTKIIRTRPIPMS